MFSLLESIGSILKQLESIVKQEERDKVHSLFERRTGQAYQNWIQALAVSEKMKAEKKSFILWLIPRWFAWLAILLFLSSLHCSYPPLIPLQDNKQVEHTYREEIDLLHLQKVTRYCATHHTWEKIQAVWDDSTYIYYTTRGS
jgi:hypothetical protein